MSMLWQVYSDANKLNVAVGPADLHNFVLMVGASIGALTLKIGEPGEDARQTCVATMSKCYKEAKITEKWVTNDILVWAESLRLARALEALIHVYDNGIHGRKWPSASCAGAAQTS